LPGTGSLPTPTIALLLIGLAVVLVGLRGRRTTAVGPTWVCGQVVESRLRWTGAGFTKPLRLALQVVLRPQRDIATREEGRVMQEVTYTGQVPHLIEERIYGPTSRLALAAAARIRRLQSGSLGTYVAYLVGLVLVLLAAARWGLVG
jgi:hydrogenase-4 component B